MSDDIDSILASARPNDPKLASTAPAASTAATASQSAAVGGEIVPAAKAVKPVVMFDQRSGGFAFGDLEGAMRLARVYLSGGAVPESTTKDCRSAEEALARVVCIIEAGKALGVRAQQALQNISVVRGRIMVWGDLAVALCQRHPDWAGMEFGYAGTLEKGDRVATVTVHRKGCPSITHAFSQADAKRAGLGGNVWTSYTDRMLFQRARSWALRDQFADGLAGMYIGEETETVTQQATVIDADDAVRMLAQQQQAGRLD